METLMFWQVIANFVLIAVTLTYVIYTIKIYKSNNRALDVMREQIESSQRPYLIITHYLTRNTTIFLRIRNTGKSAAQGLNLHIDKKFLQLGYKDYNLQENQLFAHTTESFPPEHELTFALLSTTGIKKGMENDPNTPTVFSITASYSFGPKLLPIERTVVDLRVYNKTFMPQITIADSILDVQKTLQLIADNSKEYPVKIKSKKRRLTRRSS